MSRSREHWMLAGASAACVLLLAARPGIAQILPAQAVDSGDDPWTYGPPVSHNVGAGGSYAGLGSVVTGLVGGGADYVGSTALLRAGTNTGAATVIDMAWRNRTNLEHDGDTFSDRPVFIIRGVNQYYQDGRGSTRSGVALAWDSYNNLSDVVNITGINGPYVLQMDYDDSLLIFGHAGQDEALLQDLGKIYLGWFETQGLGELADYDEWVNAIAGNSAVGPSAVLNYHGTFDEFLVDYPGFSLTDHLSSWGCDIDDDVVWAVLDHNSPFSVVPEPATACLLAVGFGIVAWRRRRR